MWRYKKFTAMPWLSFWSTKPSETDQKDSDTSKSLGQWADSSLPSRRPAHSSHPLLSSDDKPIITSSNWHVFPGFQTITSTILLTSVCIASYRFYRKYLRRVVAVSHISPSFFRKRSVLGKVTSVGDGDNFRIWHTPGGYLAGWGWWRPIPTSKKELKDKTVGEDLVFYHHAVANRSAYPDSCPTRGH